MFDAADRSTSTACISPSNGTGLSASSPETADTSVQELAFVFCAAGVPWIHAVPFVKRLARVCADLKAGRLTDDQAAARIDREAGAVFVATRAMERAA